MSNAVIFAYLLMKVIFTAASGNRITCDPCKDGNQHYYAHTSDCTKYLQCVHGSAVARNCPVGNRWDPEILTCNHDWQTKCVTAVYHKDGRVCKGRSKIQSEREPPVNKCVDTWPGYHSYKGDCNLAKQYGDCNKNGSKFTREKCRKTCGFCNAASTVNECVDVYSGTFIDCQYYDDFYDLCQSPWTHRKKRGLISNSDAGEWMMKNCRKTCHFCNRVPPVEECIDTWPGDCGSYTQLCTENGVPNHRWMLKHCKKSCGFCNKETIPQVTLQPVKECVDTYLGDCGSFIQLCNENNQWMAKNCRKTCGFCNKDFLKIGKEALTFSTKMLSWYDANLQCNSESGNLLLNTIWDDWDRQIPMEDIISYVNENYAGEQFWLGYTDAKKEGYWNFHGPEITNTILTNWIGTWDVIIENSKDCMTLNSNGTFYDDYCDTKKRYICQKDDWRADLRCGAKIHTDGVYRKFLAPNGEVAKCSRNGRIHFQANITPADFEEVRSYNFCNGTGYCTTRDPCYGELSTCQDYGTLIDPVLGTGSIDVYGPGIPRYPGPNP